MQCRSGRERDLGLLVSASPLHASVMGGTGLEERAGEKDKSRGIMRKEVGWEEGRRGGGEEGRRGGGEEGRIGRGGDEDEW